MTLEGWKHLLTPANLLFLLGGFERTLELAALSLVLSSITGLVIGVYRTWVRGIALLPAQAYIELFRNSPLLVLVFFMRFGPPVIGIHLSSFVAGVTALTVYTAAYVAETVRAGIESVPRGQWQSGLATGLTTAQTYRLIVLPQALRSMTPALLGQFINLIKGTSLISVIGVIELTRAGEILFEQYANPIETFVLIAVVYFAVNFLLSVTVRTLQSRGPALAAEQFE